jgi:hypothetical protein
VVRHAGRHIENIASLDVADNRITNRGRIAASDHLAIGPRHSGASGHDPEIRRAFVNERWIIVEDDADVGR